MTGSDCCNWPFVTVTARAIQGLGKVVGAVVNGYLSVAVAIHIHSSGSGET